MTFSQFIGLHSVRYCRFNLNPDSWSLMLSRLVQNEHIFRQHIFASKQFYSSQLGVAKTRQHSNGTTWPFQRMKFELLDIKGCSSHFWTNWVVGSIFFCNSCRIQCRQLNNMIISICHGVVTWAELQIHNFSLSQTSTISPAGHSSSGVHSFFRLPQYDSNASDDQQKCRRTTAMTDEANTQPVTELRQFLSKPICGVVSTQVYSEHAFLYMYIAQNAISTLFGWPNG